MDKSYENFKKVSFLKTLFETEQWKWCRDKNTLEVPTFEEIIECIENLEADALKCKGWAESGRIIVRYDKESDSFNYYLSI